MLRGATIIPDCILAHMSSDQLFLESKARAGSGQHARSLSANLRAAPPENREPRTENQGALIDAGSWFSVLGSQRARVTPSVPHKQYSAALQSAVGAQSGGLRDSREAWLTPACSFGDRLSDTLPRPSFGCLFGIV